MALIQVDWDAVGRIWGPLGVVFVVFILAFIGLIKLGQKLLTETIADARKERDTANARSERQAEKFIESLRIRDELMGRGFDEVLREIRGNNSRRK